MQSIGPIQLFLTCWTSFHVWDAITRKPNRPTASNIHPIVEIPLNPCPLRSCDCNWCKKKRKIKHCHLRRRHAMRAGTARSTRTELLETATKDPHVGPSPRCDRKSRKTLKKKKDKTKSKMLQGRPSAEEIDAIRLEEFGQIKHQMLSQSWIYYDMQLGVNLQSFVETLDPTKSTRLLKEAVRFGLGEQKTPLPGLIRRSNSTWRFANVAMRAAIDCRTVMPMEPVVEETMKGVSNEQLFNAYNASSRDDVPIAIDSGASHSLTPFAEDFTDHLEDTTLEQLQGLNARADVKGEGWVEWMVQDYCDTKRMIRTRAHYVPTATIRLFSPQCHLQQEGSGELKMTKNETIPQLSDQTELEFPCNCHSNLPLMMQAPTMPTAGLFNPNLKTLANPIELGGYLSVADERNQNLTRGERELLLWHMKWGHANYRWNQALLCKQADGSPPIVPPKHESASSCNTEALLCTARAMAKASRRAKQQAKRAAQFDKMVIRKGDLVPGSAVSIDQCVSTTLGRLPHTKGRESDNDKYHGGTIIVDHASQFIFIHNQVSLNVGETLKAKITFEQFAESHGHKVKHYRADNAPFGAKDFRTNIELNNQTIDYSGVGAHHQNGVAERAILTITQWARSMMIHSILMWPDQSQNILELWPFALEHAAHVWNHMPRRDSRIAPIELFTNEKLTDHNAVARLHVWGCPVCVLDPKSQDGKKVPKWNPRTRRGQCLGYSPEHSTHIGRILNLRTGHISPQFHVVHNDLFTSVPNVDSGGLSTEGVMNLEQWESLIECGRERFVDEDHPTRLPSLSDDWLTDREIDARNDNRQLREQERHLESIRRRFNAPEGARPTPEEGETAPPEGDKVEVVREVTIEAVSDGDSDVEAELDLNNDDVVSSIDDDEVEIKREEEIKPKKSRMLRELEQFNNPPQNQSREQFDNPGASDSDGVGTRRTRSQTKRALDGHFAKRGSVASRGAGFYNKGYRPQDEVKNTKWDRNKQFSMALKFKQLTEVVKGGSLSNPLHFMNCCTDQRHNTIEDWHPALLATQANTEDNPSWDEAMNGPDKAGHWKAAETEIETLERKECWDVVDREHWMNVLPGTWAFKCKRCPDGRIKKHKGRFCARVD